ncbi:mucin-7-like [Amphibalanus amphitrite]|uniref:mucin-7-like n=1 Tax=Amphibalanus amphitrite TaxID=1232801 RepID=UPI001C90229D|nr:mucin-7-like [Amphibalanus amphitrite]XP_043240312.1 mucin-7-like [Amphibalanus amphitrite]
MAAALRAETQNPTTRSPDVWPSLPTPRAPTGKDRPSTVTTGTQTDPAQPSANQASPPHAPLPAPEETRPPAVSAGVQHSHAPPTMQLRPPGRAIEENHSLPLPTEEPSSPPSTTEGQSPPTPREEGHFSTSIIKEQRTAMLPNAAASPAKQQPSNTENARTETYSENDTGDESLTQFSPERNKAEAPTVPVQATPFPASHHTQAPKASQGPLFGSDDDTFDSANTSSDNEETPKLLAMTPMSRLPSATSDSESDTSTLPDPRPNTRLRARSSRERKNMGIRSQPVTKRASVPEESA